MSKLYYYLISFVYFIFSILFILSLWSSTIQFSADTYLLFQFPLAIAAVCFEHKIISVREEEWMSQGVFKMRLHWRYWVGKLCLIPVFGLLIHSIWIGYRVYELNNSKNNTES